MSAKPFDNICLLDPGIRCGQVCNCQSLLATFRSTDVPSSDVKLQLSENELNDDNHDTSAGMFLLRIRNKLACIIIVNVYTS